MFRNYLIIAIRHILRNKVHSIINIFGLALGFASCILLYLFVMNEFSYDAFHDRADTIYCASYKWGDGFTSTPAALGPTMVNDFPEVISSLKIRNLDALIKYKENIYRERVLLTDPSFFSFFSFPLKTGSPETVLSSPNSIVLTDYAARKYFGDENPIGKTLTIKFYDKQYDFAVSGIAESPPDNSSLTFNFVINFTKEYSSSASRDLGDWDIMMFGTFIRIDSRKGATEVQGKLDAFVDRYEQRYKKYNLSIELLPLVDYHLSNQSISSCLNPPSAPIYSYILLSIALAILLIACFNFINLTMGMASTRIREIGMRTALGAYRSDILRQFWGETFVLTVFAFLTGVFLAEIFLPTFNILARISLHTSHLTDFWSLIYFFVLIAITSILAGAYPAFIFSKFNATQIFRKEYSIRGKKYLTRLFICLQFIICILLVIIVIIMNNQQLFLLNKDLGFEKDDLVTIPIFSTWERPEESETLVQILRDELIQYGIFESISGSTGLPGFSFARNGFETKAGEKLVYSHTKADYDFIKTYGINLIKGRDFSRDIATDISNAAIVNEDFLKRFSVRDPIGKRFADIFSESIAFPDGWKKEYGNWEGLWKNKTIIGVVENFHTMSLRYPIDPGFIDLDPTYPYRYLTIRIRNRRFQEAVEIIRENFQKLSPDQPFRYSFLEDDLNNLYKEEKRWNSIFFYSSLFAILLSCLGLLGLTLLIAVKRTKEIGIRKVNGASTNGIVFMLLKEFGILVIIANIISWPIAYYGMHRWLENFAYHIDITIFPFILGGFIALTIALATVSLQAVKAARANPVEALRYE